MLHNLQASQASADLFGVVFTLFMGTGRIADAQKFCFCCALCQRMDVKQEIKVRTASLDDLATKKKQTGKTQERSV